MDVGGIDSLSVVVGGVDSLSVAIGCTVKQGSLSVACIAELKFAMSTDLIQ